MQIELIYISFQMKGDEFDQEYADSLLRMTKEELIQEVHTLKEKTDWLMNQNTSIRQTKQVHSENYAEEQDKSFGAPQVDTRLDEAQRRNDYLVGQIMDKDRRIAELEAKVRQLSSQPTKEPVKQQPPPVNPNQSIIPPKAMEFSRRIGLMAAHNSKYVVAETAGNDCLKANRGHCDLWEYFELIPRGPGKFSIKSSVNSAYIWLPQKGNKPLWAQKWKVEEAEVFEVFWNQNNTINIKATTNNKWVSCEGGNLVANQGDRNNKHCQFVISDMSYRIIPTDVERMPGTRKVGIKACNGKYVVAEGGGTQPMRSNRGGINLWESFHMVSLGGSKYAFRACANGCYVQAVDGGKKPLQTCVQHVKQWETFEVTFLANNQIHIKACINNKFVCAEKGGQDILIANRDKAQGWETFTLQYI